MLVLTPNLCFDSTIRLATLSPGTVSRATATDLTGGGKGVNVIRALPDERRAHARLFGFLPRRGGARLTDLLAAEGIELSPVAVDGAVRVCTIALEDGGRTTVINGPGPHIDGPTWQALRRAVSAGVRQGEIITCNGSLPPGVPEDGYAQIVADGHRNGSQVLVDAAPGPLGRALALGPDLVCPNLSEAEGLLVGRADEQVAERGADVAPRAIAAARQLLERGARRAVVTAGALGAALATRDGTWWLTAPPVDVVSPIGAGDSFVSGTAADLEAGRPDIEAVTTGVAVASASCEGQLAGGVDHDRVAVLRRHVIVERVAARPTDPMEVRP